MKKKIKNIIIIICLIALSCAFFFIDSVNALINDGAFKTNIIFIVFGFCLTCYTFITAILNKALCGNLRQEHDYKEIKSRNRIYLNATRKGLISIFIMGFISVIFDFLAEMKSMSNISFNFFQLLNILNFLLALTVAFDIVLSILIISNAAFERTSD